MFTVISNLIRLVLSNFSKKGQFNYDLYFICERKKLQVDKSYLRKMFAESIAIKPKLLLCLLSISVLVQDFVFALLAKATVSET